MSYTEGQIKQYLDILHNYTKQPVEGEAGMDVSKKAKCCNCKIVNFLILILVIKFVITVE